MINEKERTVKQSLLEKLVCMYVYLNEENDMNKVSSLKLFSLPQKYNACFYVSY